MVAFTCDAMGVELERLVLKVVTDLTGTRAYVTGDLPPTAVIIRDKQQVQVRVGSERYYRHAPFEVIGPRGLVNQKTDHLDVVVAWIDEALGGETS